MSSTASSFEPAPSAFEPAIGETPPDVSVVIPVFNAGRYLREAIASALGQRGASCEILVVDDGSIDDTPEIIVEFGDAIRAFAQPNHGVSISRNRGALEARGEYLWFLDADDRLLPGAVEKLVRALRESGAMFGYGQAYAIDESGSRTSESAIGYYGPGRNTLRRMCHGTLFPPSAGLFHRETFLRLGGFDPDISHGEDLDLEYRFAQDSEATMISEAVVEYRFHVGSATRNYPKMFEQALGVHRKHSKHSGTWIRYPLATLAGRGKLGFYFGQEHRNARLSGEDRFVGEAWRTVARHPWLIGLVGAIPILERVRRRVHRRLLH